MDGLICAAGAASGGPLDFILADPCCQRVMCGLPDRPAMRHRSGTDISREVLVLIKTDKAIHAIGEEQGL